MEKENNTVTTETIAKTPFEVLNKIDVSKHIEKKGPFSYLPWAYAWGTLKSVFPTSTYRVIKSENGWCYHTDGATAWVEVGVTVENEEIIEYYPITDFKNNSLPLDKVTSRIANDSIQRALVKAIARHGLGLYIYAGEDVPVETAYEEAEAKAQAKAQLVEKQNLLAEKLKDCDLTKVAGLYKKNSIKEFGLKELENALNNVDKIIDLCSAKATEKAEAETETESEPEAPKPQKAQAKADMPTCLAEAVNVPCSLTKKTLKGKTLGEIFGEGNLEAIKFMAEEYKGTDEAMRKAAQIILEAQE